MASDPLESDIAQVAEFASCDRDTAIKYLKVKNNNAEAAIMAIFDGEDISKAETELQWNENDFHADRDGQQRAYNDNDYIQPLGAPTRGSTPVPSLKQPTTSDEEDAGLQQALAASRAVLGIGQDQQEMGVISGGKQQQFGPATRSQYDPNQWAVTLPGQEVMPDLEPMYRANRVGEPRCLRPLPSHDYLPNLLTILHSIPLSRKALLMPHDTRPSYGHDSEWWKGHTIRFPRIVSTVDLASADPATTESGEMITEMQRLMALLDASSRSYGSVDSLLRLDAVNNMTSELPAETLVERVLRAWEMAATHSDPDASLAKTFRSRMGTNNEEGMATPYMHLMPFRIGDNHQDRPVTLTEAMNELLWDLDEPEEYDFYIEQPADVLCMHVSREDKSVEQAGLIIPPLFYIDQYLKENVGETRGLRAEIAKAKDRVSSITRATSMLQGFSRGDSKGRIESSLLMGHAIGHFSGQNKQAMLEERLASGADVNVDLPSPAEHHGRLVERLNAVYDGVKERLEMLSEEGDKAKEVLSKLWQSTSQSLPADSLKHRYWLRGVATKSTVTYLLRPRGENTDDGMMEDEDAPEGMQWWRIEYDENGTRITKTLAAQDDVIRAVELENKEALVIYASDAAIAPQKDDELPTELREFIRKDDELFDLELQIAFPEVGGGGGSRNANVSQLEHVGGRRGSTDSTAVNWGDEIEPPPYEDDDDPPAHEIMLDGVDPEHHDDDDDDGGEMEMVETANHEPLTIGASAYRGDGNNSSNDGLMMGTRQAGQGEEAKVEGEYSVESSSSSSFMDTK